MRMILNKGCAVGMWKLAVFRMTLCGQSSPLAYSKSLQRQVTHALTYPENQGVQNRRFGGLK